MKPMNSGLCLTVPLPILRISSPAPAAEYAYHPRSRVYLGGGYDPYHPDTAYLPCINYSSIDQVDTQGATNTVVKMLQVKTRQDFYQLTNFSASLAGSYLFMSGGGSVESIDEEAFHEDSFTWMVYFNSSYGRFVLHDPSLKSELIRTFPRIFAEYI